MKAMSKDDEMILVVPTALFREVGYFQGFCADAEKYRSVLLAPENVSFRRRGDMEHDPSFKQLIPYMLFCWNNPVGGELSVFAYTRGSGMGEERLHAKTSVGVGGHINNIDMAHSLELGAKRDFYREGLQRELNEEIVVNPAMILSESCVGLINDDTNDVGTVHLGIVHRFDLAEPLLSPNEPDLIESGFRTLSELFSGRYRFESWSEISLNALFGGDR